MLEIQFELLEGFSYLKLCPDLCESSLDLKGCNFTNEQTLYSKISQTEEAQLVFFCSGKVLTREKTFKDLRDCLRY